MITTQSDLLMNSDFATAITTLQQPYNRMDVNALIRVSIERRKDKIDPSRRASKLGKGGSFRRENVEKTLKNVAGAVEARAANLFGRVKSWASEKKKRPEISERSVRQERQERTANSSGSGSVSSPPLPKEKEDELQEPPPVPEFVEEASLFAEGDSGLFDSSEGGGGLFD